MTSPSDSQSAKPSLRHAATVMLLREVRDTTEVLVIRRHENLAFMGGLWVFPGGTVSPADSSTATLARIPESSLLSCPPFKDVQGNPLAREQCLALAVAAHRETFEETGVLLAEASSESASDGRMARLHEQRQAIVEHPELFATLLSNERLVLEVERLTYWAHWITPSHVSRRFDTRFFAIPVPTQQTASIDAMEAVDHAWMTPAELVDAAEHGKMPLSQPTLYNVMTLDASLAAHGSLRAMLAAESNREIPPVLPKLVRGATTMMVLPWDPHYHELPGEGVSPDVAYPKWLRDLPPRMATRV